ncbi:hypothetical protein [Thalassospira aquimaris]|uniref:DUF4382 domain-containing protein n=1 Tax=Thalassospira aquimaris TaxID=3037796 RepID=A0ABT6GGX3_9PROT|nr:hypothetical protein [Thalassospira sp. FZY0004]MDG4721158.1 hypothetical protein [Thalassospira sp. FZY0004]
MAKKALSIQLADHLTGKAIMAAGGYALICAAGSTKKLTMYQSGSTVSVVSLTNGKLECEVDVDLGVNVDIYMQAPTGHGVVATDIVPSGPSEIRIDQNARHSMLRIPFHVDDASSETDTGFVEPTNGLILPNPTVNVTAIDAGITIDVGTDSGDSGDADGFMDGVSVATLGLAKGTIATGGVTLGALLKADTGSGVMVPEGRVSAGKAITYTLTGSPDTAAGVINLPVLLG